MSIYHFEKIQKLILDKNTSESEWLDLLYDDTNQVFDLARLDSLALAVSRTDPRFVANVIAVFVEKAWDKEMEIVRILQWLGSAGLSSWEELTEKQTSKLREIVIAQWAKLQ